MHIPVGLAGSVTIVFLVGFGIFLYPMLLARPRGALVVAALTLVLVSVFFYFDNPDDSGAVTSAVLAVIWALAPVGTALLVKRLRDRAAKNKAAGSGANG